MYQLRHDDTLEDRIGGYIKRGWLSFSKSYHIHVEDTLESRLMGTTHLRRLLNAGELVTVYSDNDCALHNNTYLADAVAYGSHPGQLSLVDEFYSPLDISHKLYAATLNSTYWNEWRHNKEFIADVVEALDAFVEDFVDNGPDELLQVVYGTYTWRPINIKTTDRPSMLQHDHLWKESKKASRDLAGILGTNLDTEARNTILIN